MQFDSDQRFREAWLFYQIEVLLLPSVHKLDVFSLLLQDHLHVLHIEFLILVVELLLLVELLIEFSCFARFNLQHLDISVFDWLGHQSSAFVLQLS